MPFLARPCDSVSGSFFHHLGINQEERQMEDGGIQSRAHDLCNTIRSILANLQRRLPPSFKMKRTEERCSTSACHLFCESSIQLIQLQLIVKALQKLQLWRFICSFIPSMKKSTHSPRWLIPILFIHFHSTGWTMCIIKVF